MAQNIMSTIFIFTLIFTVIIPASTVVTSAVAAGGSYWICMFLCTSGAGAFAGVMSAGVAAPAGMLYGAAACSSVCSGVAVFCATATAWAP